MHPIAKDAQIVIIGAGCFGASTAYHLLLQGYANITILDRALSLPAPDASSNDINRVVRSSYADKFYSGLVLEATSLWKDQEKWGNSYHESGVLLLGLSTGNDGDTYTDEAYKNDIAVGSRVQALRNGNAIRTCFPPCVPLAAFDGCTGYLNRDGGWVNAGESLTLLLRKIKDLGGKILPAKQVSHLIRHKESKDKAGHGARKIIGIQCSDGTLVHAELVIVATGSWTQSTFPELGLGSICIATGHATAVMALSKTEADMYRQCPIVVNFNEGFYVFPPNENNLLKVGVHTAGYTYFNENNPIPTPRTMMSDPETGHFIPKAALQDLRKHLTTVYPELAKKPLSATRLCWYNDTPDEDWIISRHPEDPSVILTTGGSGHAFKFLPVIGRLVVDLIEDKLEKEIVAKFAVDRKVRRACLSRSGQTVNLDVNEVCTVEDLLS